MDRQDPSAGLPAMGVDGKEEELQGHWTQTAMAPNIDALADVGPGVTLDDWEQLGLDQEPLFWEAALDTCPDLMLNSHPNGEDKLWALGRGSPEARGSDSSENRNSPLRQFLEDEFPQQILEMLPKDNFWNSSFESCLGDSWLESFLGDPESLQGSEVTHKKRPTPCNPESLPALGVSSEESLPAGRSIEDSSAEPRQPEEEEWESSSHSSHLVEHQGVYTQEKPPLCANQMGLSQYVFLLVWPVPARTKSHGCKECGRCFARSVDLRRHQRLHTRGQAGDPAVCHPQRVRRQKALRIVKAYKCDQCELAFTQALQLASHCRSHRRTHRHASRQPSATRSHSCSSATRATPATECEQCGKAFRRAAALTRHRMAHTGEKPYKCSECQKGFSYPTTLRLHQRSHAGTLPYQCGTCGKAFCQRGRLRDHQRSHTRDRPHPCPHCARSFNRATQLLRHQSSHGAGQLFSCAKCQETFSCREHLERHQKSHAIEAPHECPLCGERFVCRSTLHCHLAGHRGQKPGLNGGGDVGEHGAHFKCGKCGKGFSLSKSLAWHEKIHEKAKAFVCLQCGKAFSQAPRLRRHQNSHSQEKARRSSFIAHPQSSPLSEHPLTHAAGKPLKCSQCGMVFTHRSGLTQHQRSHTTRKHFPCAECGKTFRQSCSLSRHLRVHSGEKPYPCHHCGKAFAQRANLSRHERTHTGEKPFMCDVCGRTFAVRAHLNQHRRIHTQEKPYRCPHCAKTFRSCPGLSRHRRQSHSTSRNTSCNLAGAAEPRTSELAAPSSPQAASLGKSSWGVGNGDKNRRSIEV